MKDEQVKESHLNKELHLKITEKIKIVHNLKDDRSENGYICEIDPKNTSFISS